MYSCKTWSQALGQSAKNQVKRQAPPPIPDRKVAEETYLKIKQTIEENDKWTQAEVRDALKFKDHNGVNWRLSIINKHARLSLILFCEGNGMTRSWASQPLLVGGLVKKDSERIGFGMAVEYSHFSQWRTAVQRDRPLTHKSLKGS